MANTITDAFDHNLIVVLISYFVSVAGVLVSLFVADYVHDRKGRIRFDWLGLAAIVFGSCGVWAMHFIGTLAYQLGTPVSYGIDLVLLSLVIPLIFGYFSFYMAYRSPTNGVALLLAGVVFGFGVFAMHYTALASMRIAAEISYVPWIVGVTALLSVVAVAASLHVFTRWRGAARRLSPYLIAALMAAVHYTGMASMRVGLSDAVEVDYFSGALSRDAMTFVLSVEVVVTLLIGVALILARKITDLEEPGFAG